MKILIAVAIGALVGLERERRAKGETIAGFRTFMLVTLFGLLSGYLSDTMSSPVPIYIGFLSIGLLASLSYYSKMKNKSVGLTTEIALILAFIIGLIVIFDSYPFFLTVSLGIILTLILLSLETSHKFARHIKQSEIRDAVIFAMFAFTILPMLPNQAIDPFGVINPYEIWYSIVIVLSISFAAYIAMKVFGARYGLALTGLFGGLVSSTAVTIDMAGKIRKNKRILHAAAFAVIAASSTMFLRQLFFATMINAKLFMLLAPTLVALAVIGYFSSYLYWKKSGDGKSAVEIKSPLSLKPALQFSLMLVAVSALAKFAESYSSGSLFAIALLAGMLDADATTVSLAVLTINSFNPAAAVAIIVAGLANTVMKWLLLRWLGNKKISVQVGRIFAVLVAAGIVLLSFLAFK